MELEKAIIFDFNLALPIIAITASCSRDECGEGGDISMKREVIVDLEVKMAGIIKNDMGKKLLVSCNQFGALFFLSL
ncbi:hypothetical protein AMTRI_Chr08g167950 [Amborella trichopoda]